MRSTKISHTIKPPVAKEEQITCINDFTNYSQKSCLHEFINLYLHMNLYWRWGRELNELQSQARRHYRIILKHTVCLYPALFKWTPIMHIFLFPNSKVSTTIC